MLRLASRTFARLILCAPVLAFMPSAIAAPVAAEGETASISPWEIEAVYKNDRFDRCAISRNLDDEISVTFMRTGEGLSLLLASPHWKLETGKNYPVTLKLGPQSWEREVDAEASAVSVVVEDGRFVSGLRVANTLDVIAAGDTIQVPLDGSAAAFERLDQCVAKNGHEPQPNCDSAAGATDSKACSAGVAAETEGSAASDAMVSSEAQSPPLPAARPEVEVETGGNPAGDGVVPSEGEVPPPPAAKPAVEVTTEENPAEDAIATSEEEVPPSPAAKPAVEVKTEEKPAEDAIATSEEEVPPSPAAKPAAESETEGASPEDAVASSGEEIAPPAAKPEKAPVEPAAKKASPKKKQTTQSSAKAAKRAFKREVDRLRRFFGN